MDLLPYVDQLRRDLLATADGAGPDVRAAAERLAHALDPAIRLALMEALSQAAAEITAEMPEGGVDVRLDGRDLAFVVHSPPAPPPAAPHPPVPPTAPAPAPPGGPQEGDEDGGVARITLRLPEAVKTRAEDAAAAAGQSLNTWLVGAVRAATRDPDRAARVDVDLSSIPLPGRLDPFAGRGGRRMTGWL